MYQLQLLSVGICCIALATQSCADSILSNDFQMFNVDVDESGQPVFTQWTPSKADLKSINYIDIDNRDTKILHVKHALKKDEVQVFKTDGLETRTDYIDLKRNISQSKFQSGPVNAVVEIVIVCDKEFSDVFNHDNKRIMDYLTVYMWDVNLRYKTLPSDNISFRVNGIVVISNINAQPFIEEARAPDGRAEFGRILEKYSSWVYSQRNSLPKLDMAPLITNTNLEWGGGLAYMNAACWVDDDAGKNLGTAVWNDNGGWGSVTVGIHEMGHNLGAPHDDDPNFPGGCPDKGFIMGGGNDDYRFFFSSCSDRLISQFVRSESASCLQRIDGPVSPVLDPSYSNPKAPSMEDHCRRSLNNEEAYIETGDTYDCRRMRCLTPGENGTIYIHSLAQVENVLCGADEMRCYRGRCRRTGMMYRNVASNLCMRAANPFEFASSAEMFNCPSEGTPLDRFVEFKGPSNTIILATPFSYDGNKENNEKCLYTGNTDGDYIKTDRCDNILSFEWSIREAGNDEFLLVHKETGSCAKPSNGAVGSLVQTFLNCDASDREMLWSKYL